MDGSVPARLFSRGKALRAHDIREKTLAALRASLVEGRDYFVAVANAMPHFIWLADPDGTINFFNERWIRYTGVTVDDMQGEGTKGIVHPAEVELTRQRWSEAIQTGAPYEVEYRLRNVEDGSYRWFLARALPVRDESGRNPLWIGTATDIDAQKRSRESLEFLLGAVSAFASSHGVDEVCDRFAKLAVEQFADWCHVSLFREPDTFTTVAAAYKDLAFADRGRELEQIYRVQRRTKLEVDELRSAPILYPTLPKGRIRAASIGDQFLQLARSLQVQSIMVVPLRAPAGDFFGTISFGSMESHRTFTPEDLTVAERAATRAAEAIRKEMVFDEERRTTQRLRFLAKANEELFESLDIKASFQRLAELLVSEIADMAFIALIDGNGLRTVGAAHNDPGKAALVDRFRGVRMLHPRAERAMIAQLRENRPSLSDAVPLRKIPSTFWPYLSTDFASLHPISAITVPIFARGVTYGGIFVYYSESDRVYDSDDLPTLIEIARRTSVAIENVQSYERERRIAATMQKASLPPALPKVADLRFEGVYTTASQSDSFGGDWYDAIAFDDGTVMVSVGDVSGSGIEAAVIMSKVRHIIGVGPLHQNDPTKILDAADWILSHRYPDAIVTAFVGIISADRRTIRFANAGHPYPIIRRGGDLIELQASGLPLGLRKFAAPSPTETATLEAGDMLVLFTDGLTEWGHDWAEGERRLRSIVSTAAVGHTGSPGRFIHDACLTQGSRDDVALMTVALGKPESWAFETENAFAAQDARTEFISYLRDHIHDDAAIDQAELVFGELMANVVRHAPGPVSVYVDWCGNDPVVHVIDRGPGFHVKANLPEAYCESGRGLYLIQSSSADVFVERIEDYGNHVSVRLLGKGASNE
jgi:sigma-B regulation protein RsbU (phosphoserine phosphatase)